MKRFVNVNTSRSCHGELVIFYAYFFNHIWTIINILMLFYVPSYQFFLQQLLKDTMRRLILYHQLIIVTALII